MRFRSSCLLLALALFVAAITGCSRESSIRENVSLRNNHSVVFAFNKPFKDAEAFADSIINLDHPDSVLVYDTLTITVNDTVYLMGFLRYNTDKIYRYIWHFEEPFHKDSKDTLQKDCEFYFNGETEKGCNYATENSDNAKPHFRVYADTGLYSPLFIAIDGNNARDTAGIGQFVRVINTAPFLSVPKDTLWTRYKGEITFPIVARDSFGVIKSVKIDPDANGKEKPQTWKFKELGGDSLQVTIKYDANYVDSVGNQKIYIIAVDEDKNETKDSVNLHFNQLPKLKLISPEDSSTQNEKERLILHFDATDIDNPASLRYFVRAANPILSDTSNEEFVPNFTDRYLVAENMKEPYFVAVDANGENNLGISGRVYWDVWVTDGFDTVFSDKIKEKDGSLRPRTFLLVDLKNPYGVFRGFAQYQGRADNSGILIEVRDSINKYLGVTDEKGYYSISVPAGFYNISARDTTGSGFTPDSLSFRHIELGQTVTLEKLILKDTLAPELSIDNDFDTLNVRSFELSGKAQDIGSQVKNVLVWFDDEEKEISFFGGYNKVTNKWTWRMQLDSLTEGEHSFKAVALDSAGNKSDTLKFDFIVHASSIELTIDSQVKKMFHHNDELKFVAVIKNHDSPIDSMNFVSSVKGAKEFWAPVKNDSATLTLKISDFPDDIESGVFFSMIAKTRSDMQSTKVDFGFYGTDPTIYFESPSDSSIVSIKDSIHFKVVGLANNDDPEDPSFTLTWNCGAVTPCIENNTQEGSFSWTTTGTQKLFVTIKNKDGKTSKDSLTVIVVPDPPTMKAKTDNNLTQKINSKVDIQVTASDKFGSISEMEWGCSSGTSIFAFDESKTFDTAPKSINETINIQIPGTASDDYHCIVQVIDDDNETASDTIKFKVILDKPYVSLNIKKQTLTVLDETNFDFMAGDTLGKVVKYEKTCSNIKDYLNTNWQEFSGQTTVTMPANAGTFYCAIQVTDDDGNTANDTAEYKVLQATPWVSVMSVPTATIKDTVYLDADAHDSTQYGGTFLNGSIVKYEWGCGNSGTNIDFAHVSTSTPEYQAILPATDYSDYLCIIRVTDDDGNTALDTAHIAIMLDPPSVNVDKETTTVREGFSIILDAYAEDGYGDIVKREWSCGSPTEIESNWKTVDDFYTTWKAPAPTLNYMCVARATDDDGLTARDTMTVKFSTENPVITVTEELIYVVPEMEFDLNATKNDDVWSNDNVSWYMWECYDAATKKRIKSESKYGYKENGNQFYKHQDGSYTEKGKDIYCVVTAEEASTGATFSDTTQIKIIVTPPTGVITAADTVYLWSGDESVSDDAIYFYSPEWGGMNSTMGPMGDASNQSFRWSFSNVDDGYYTGNTDGTLDTSIAEFNEAFIRSTRESSMTICLDYRDSNTTTPSEAFYLRHRAEEVCRKVYFRKAWKNLATSDTVLEKSELTTPPVITSINNKPIEIYLTSSTQVAAKRLDGSSWASLSTSAISASDSITSLQVATNGTDLYLAVLTAGHKLHVYKSAGGTSAFASVGSEDVSGEASSADITCASDGTPFVTYLNTGSLAYLSKWDGSSWQTVPVSTPSKQIKTNQFTVKNCQEKTQGSGRNRKTVTVCDTTYTYIKQYAKAREVHSIVSNSGVITTVFVDTTSHYQGYYNLFNTSLELLKAETAIDTSMSVIDLATDGSDLYIGYENRSTEHYGPYVKHATIGSSSLSFDNSTQFKTPITPGSISYHISIAAKAGKVFAIIDDKNKPSLSQTHVFHLDGGKWKPYGENELPYFKVSFYKIHNYYLRGSLPDICISDNENVYISMLAWENAGGNGNNFGPLVMKYVADNWTVH